MSPNRHLTFNGAVHLGNIQATRGKLFVPCGQSVCVTSRAPFFVHTEPHTNKLHPALVSLHSEPCPANQRRVSIFQRTGWVFHSLSFFRVQFRYSKKSTHELCLTVCGQPPIKQPPVSAALVCECGWSERLKLSEKQ